MARVGEKQWEWISRDAAAGSCSGRAAWSPETRRLAVFTDELSRGEYHLLGRGRRRSRSWVGTLGLPAVHGPWRAWQCEWSPDESSLLFRFYGHAERDPDAAGHLAVVDPDTGATRFGWGAEAGPARWIDPEWLAFRADDHGRASEPRPLVLARPRTGERRLLLDNVIAWALASDRAKLWALTSKGSLHGIRTRGGHASREFKAARAGERWNLAVAPTGETLVLWTPWSEVRPAVRVHSTETGALLQELELTDPVEVLGWRAGEATPLLAVRLSPETDEWRIRAWRQ